MPVSFLHNLIQLMEIIPQSRFIVTGITNCEGRGRHSHPTPHKPCIFNNLLYSFARFFFIKLDSDIRKDVEDVEERVDIFLLVLPCKREVEVANKRRRTLPSPFVIRSKRGEEWSIVSLL